MWHAHWLRALVSGRDAVQRDGLGSDDQQGGPVDRVGHGDGGVAVQPHPVAVAVAPQQVHADQLGHVGGAGPGGDLADRARLGDPALLQDDHPVRQRERVERVVGDQDRGAVEVGQVVAQVAPHGRPGAGVERRQRLVQQQEPGIGGQRPGQRRPLRLSAGHGRRPGPGVVGQPDPVDPDLRRPPGRCPGRAPGPGAEGDVVEHGEVGEQQVVLEDHADRPVLGRDEGRPVGVVHHAAVQR